MTTIGLVANDQLLAVTLNPKVSSGNQKTVTVQVDFSDEWDGFGKSAVFFTSLDTNTVYEKVITNGECVVPAEVLEQPCNLYIGVRGVNSDINGIKTTSLVKYKIVEGSPSGTGTEIEPTADVYQQLMTAVNKAITLVESFEGNTLTKSDIVQTLENGESDKAPSVALVKNELDELNSRDIFSTEEQVVGKWLDGKPIYRKLLQIALPNYCNDIPHGISNIGSYLSIDHSHSFLVSASSGYFYPLSSMDIYDTSADYYSASGVRHISNTHIYVVRGIDIPSDVTGYVAILYTKAN